MSRQQESIARTLLVAFVVCLVCSVIVASAAVLLRPTQVENRQLDRQRYILEIAGLARPDASTRDIQRIFHDRIKARVVDLDSGRYTDRQQADTFDPLQAAKDPAQSMALTGADDIASIHRREYQSIVYQVEDEHGGLQTLILPVRGYGLWSTLYGFIALKSDLNTVVGLGFYQQAETAGLGGEVDNPRWRALWPGKQVFDGNGQPDITIIKGTVDPSNPRAAHQVDGLAGASLTSKGVGNLLKFWLGPKGFGPFIAHLRNASPHSSRQASAGGR
ncbi:MAG: Na(+)-translocating NADH-quinone reductase subunit C [Lautropia sp.]|nr:Na(+)-translocating NADH-quinone reductase subunit C [Lautropia sp.]